MVDGGEAGNRAAVYVVFYNIPAIDICPMGVETHSGEFMKTELYFYVNGIHPNSIFE